MKYLNKNLNTKDPFKTLSYPSGCTGLVVRVLGYDFARCVDGYHYLLKKVIESQDVFRNGESICTASPPFYNTYWRFKTKEDLKFFYLSIITGKVHYRLNIEPITFSI